MNRFLTPYLSLIDITDCGASPENIDSMFSSLMEENENTTAFLLPLSIDGVIHQKELRNVVTFQWNDEEDVGEFDQSDESFSTMLSFMFDEFSDAFNDDEEAQKHFISHSILLAKTLVTSFSNIQNIFGTFTVETSHISAEEDDTLTTSYSVALEADDRLYLMTHYINNKVGVVNGTVPFIKLDADKDHFAEFSVRQATGIFFKMLNDHLIDEEETVLAIDKHLVVRNDWYYLMPKGENPRIYNFNMFIDKIVNDAEENPTELYRALKSCDLFTADVVSPVVATDVEYIDSFNVASMLEDFSEKEDWIDEELIEGIEAFGSSETEPLSGILLSLNQAAETVFEDLSLSIEASMYGTAGVIGYNPSDTVDPAAQLFKDIDDIYHGIVERTGSLIGKRNEFIINVGDEQALIETEFGQLDITQIPVWMTLLVLPFINYLLRTVVSPEEITAFNEEPFYEDPMFVSAVSHLKELAFTRVN